MSALVVREAGAGAMGARGGPVLAAGAGWAWIRDGLRPVHLTGADGPRGPLTAVVGRVPVLRPGEVIRLDPEAARPWRTPRPPDPAPPERVAAACAAVRAHLWNDPRALALADGALPDLVMELAGRGPGLTPAGDDALLGHLLARRALARPTWRSEAATVLAAARRASGGASLLLVRWAARGEAPEPAAAMLAALLRAEGGALAAGVRRLVAYGRTTGRAILTGLVTGLRAS